jgi:hypothetical protein
MADDRPQVDPKSIRTSLLLGVGPLVFLLHFSAVYAFNAVACARGSGPAGVPAFVLAASIVASALVLLVVFAERRHWRAPGGGGGHSDRAEYDPPARRAFVGHLAGRIALLALVGIWLVALPTLLAQPCA